MIFVLLFAASVMKRLFKLVLISTCICIGYAISLKGSKGILNSVCILTQKLVS